jgi:hypothetical protein
VVDLDGVASETRIKQEVVRTNDNPKCEIGCTETVKNQIERRKKKEEERRMMVVYNGER